MIALEIWASGSGSNAERMHEYFSGHPHIRIAGFMTNNPSAGVIQRAERLGIPCRVIPIEQMRDGSYLADLQQRGINGIVLAGYLKLVPEDFLHAFPDRIINVHPALLPHYGGKNMYGDRVHRAVLEAGEHTTGITIHLVNERYDEGRILAQFSTSIDQGETLESLLPKIRSLEHTHFPVVVEDHFLNVRS